MWNAKLDEHGATGCCNLIMEDWCFSRSNVIFAVTAVEPI
jgi:hypothetical protein